MVPLSPRHGPLLATSSVIAISQNARSCDDTAAALKLCIEHFTSTDVNVKNELDDKKEEIPYE